LSLHAASTADAPVSSTTSAGPTEAEAAPQSAAGIVEDHPAETHPVADVAEARTTFADLGLSDVLLRAIAEKGYVHPTPIQEQAIPIVLQGRDVLGCAQTGTGKTASFTLPMMEILSGSRARARMPRSLILEPTRELALQVAENFVLYGKYLKLNHALLIGGESLSDQKEVLMRGVDVLIATPGRLIDMFERGGLLLSDTRILVIDEADRMLDMGFIPDVERIVSLLPSTRQTLFFSATMAKEIRRLADAFLQNPKEITTSAPATVATTITSNLVVVAEEDKRRALRRIIRTEEVQNALIFSNRKRDVDILYKSLQRHGFSVGALHGDMPQSARFATLEKFRAGEIRLLVCSDVAARGIDIGGLSHVFNFDVPHHAEDYVHRIGRTGRAGREGRAFTIATPDQQDAVIAIERLTGAPISRVGVEGFEPLDWLEGGDDHRRRGGKGRGKSKPKAAAPSQPAVAKPEPAAPPPAAATTAEPVAATSPQSQPRAQTPRRERGGQRGRDRSDAPHGDRPARVQQGNGGAGNGGARSSAAAASEAPRRGQPDPERGAAVVGFGDDIPAFMLIRRRGAGSASVDAPGFVAGPDLPPEPEDDEDQR
jgi:superfamily II DNA/RNA helicase